MDIINRQIDAEASRLLADLRDERLTSKIETTNYQRYVIIEYPGPVVSELEVHWLLKQSYPQKEFVHLE